MVTIKYLFNKSGFINLSILVFIITFIFGILLGFLISKNFDKNSISDQTKISFTTENSTDLKNSECDDKVCWDNDKNAGHIVFTGHYLTSTAKNNVTGKNETCDSFYVDEMEQTKLDKLFGGLRQIDINLNNLSSSLKQKVLNSTQDSPVEVMMLRPVNAGGHGYAGCVPSINYIVNVY